MATTSVLRFDGGSRGNPGKAGCGFVIYNSATDDTKIIEGWQYLGDKNTNNYAEYYGIILGLQEALSKGLKNLHIEGDSLLVINQLLGKWKVKAENLQPLYEKAKELLKQFDNYTLTQIPRNKNKVADKLANYAMDNPE